MALPAEPQRERAVAILKRAYAEGRLEHDDFAVRAQRALAARSPWELRLQLRGLLVEDVRARARIAVRIAAIALGWVVASLFLLVSTLVEAISSHASRTTLLFPLAWLALSFFAWRAVRRARRTSP